jgi:phosphate-selective porin OprO/OprP
MSPRIARLAAALLLGLGGAGAAPAAELASRLAFQPSATQRLSQGESSLTDDALADTAGPRAPEGRELAAEGVEAPGETEAEQLAQAESAVTDDALTVGADVKMLPEWNNGLELFSTNREFRVHVGGRMQYDTTGFTAGNGPNLPANAGGVNPRLAGGTNPRRGRLRIDGQMYENFEFLNEWEFVQEQFLFGQQDPVSDLADGPLPAPTEVWAGISKLPWIGNIRIGNQNTLTGLEHITSDRWLNFMERSYLADAFTMPFNNAYAPGILIFNNALENDRVWWGVGAFKNSYDIFGFSNTPAANSLQGRLTGLVIDDPENNRWMHLGLCATWSQQANPVNNTNAAGEVTQFGGLRYRVRGNIRNGPPGPMNSIYVETGILDASHITLLTAEYAANFGPLSMQAEWTCNIVPRVRTALTSNPTYGQQPVNTVINNLFYQGAYCEILYALTGEGRAYNKRLAVLDRFVPRSNFYVMEGRRRMISSPGAWQIGARYDWVNLNDQGLNGGMLNGVTLGLNWIMNPNMRAYFNYDFAYRDFVNMDGVNGSGGINGFGARMAMDF